jgi:hypothetical protein
LEYRGKHGNPKPAERERRSLMRPSEKQESLAFSRGELQEYFYGDKDEDKFNQAWLHHIHNNEHHWQYWVLIMDDGDTGEKGKVVALEMPKVYVWEMVADWWSFSWRSGKLTEIFDWYDSHKGGIILHENTRKLVEDILAEIRELVEAGK